MTLSEYVDRVMSEKGLSAYEVERRCDGQISDSYVQRIRDGASKRPSVPRLRALAKGLGVDFNEILTVAEGREPGPGWTPQSLVDAMQKIVASEALTEMVQEAVSKDEESVKRALKYLKRK